MISGVLSNHIICTSYEPCSIPEGKNIYEWLRIHLDADVYVIFLLSNDYYQSANCLNEMGAAWVKRTEYSMILFPGFSYDDIKGCVDNNQISIKLDEKGINGKFNSFKERIEEFYDISINQTLWEDKREELIKVANEEAKRLK